MEWFCYAKFPLHANLKTLDTALNQRGLVHRFTEEKNEQYLWLYDRSCVSEVYNVIHTFAQGGVVVEENTLDVARNSGHADIPLVDQFLLMLVSAPITVSIVLMGICGFLAEWLLPRQLLVDTVFLVELNRVLGSAQFWKTLTPTFIHFGALHIIFNALWIWFLGRHIEQSLRKVEYIGLFLSLAVAANLVQYSFAEHSVFGGLSGVVYGYLGFCLIARNYVKAISEGIQKGIYIFMLVWLILGYTGLVDIFVAGSIANWNHLGGLLSGLLWGYVYFKLDVFEKR